MDRVFSFMRANGFNALRVPFSAELALDPNRVVQVADPALNNLGNLARLARFVDVAAQYNILVRGVCLIQ
jgi:aryl-phospho-beta-D-glucosidase BglC (GH1 family)